MDTIMGRRLQDTARRDIYLDRAQNFTAELCHFTDSDGTPTDTTGWTFEMHIRANPYAPTALIEATVASGHLTVDGAAVSLTLSAEEVDGSLGGAHYDLRVVRDGLPPWYILRGHIYSQIRITR